VEQCAVLECASQIEGRECSQLAQSVRIKFERKLAKEFSVFGQLISFESGEADSFLYVCDRAEILVVFHGPLLRCDEEADSKDGVENLKTVLMIALIRTAGKGVVK
jgi:hypothetical protein